MDVWCVCAFFCVYVVLCLGRGLATGWSLVQGVLPPVNDQETEESPPMLQSGSKEEEKYVLSHLGVLRDSYGLDLLTPYLHNSRLQAIQRYRYSTHFTVHRYTRARILSLHQSYPDNGFITVSLLTSNHIWSLLITVEFLFCRFFSVTLDCHPQNWTEFLTTDCSFGTSRYVASGRSPRKTPSSFVPYNFRRVYWSVA
jgi:hypothetical protein